MIGLIEETTNDIFREYYKSGLSNIPPAETS
jgi:hypothetical protein